MSSSDPWLSRNQRHVIDLLIQRKQEWRRLYGIQELALLGSLARNEAISGSDVDHCVILEPPNSFLLVHVQQAVQQLLGVRVDVVTHWPGMTPILKQEIERDAIQV